jgi:hypothetical protein
MSRNFALEVESIISQLQPIRAEVLQAEQSFREELDNVHLGTLQSARNLAHYVSLRRHDLRELQQDLGRLAVSSLGRLESHVIATLDDSYARRSSGPLCKIAGKKWHGRAIEETFAEFDSGSALLEKHTTESLREMPDDRNVRIMVTMPSVAASDPNLVRDFLNRGMSIMRINCAHDSAEEWLRMVENLQAAEEETGKTCKIAFTSLVQNCEPARFLRVPVSSAGNLCETNSGGSQPVPLLRSVTTTTLVRVRRSPFRSRALFFGTLGREILLSSPTRAGANERCMSSKSTSQPAFARTTERATSLRDETAADPGKGISLRKTRSALCRMSNTPFLLVWVTISC